MSRLDYLENEVNLLRTELKEATKIEVAERNRCLTLAEANQKLKTALEAVASNQHRQFHIIAENWKECPLAPCRTAGLAWEIP